MNLRNIIDRIRLQFQDDKELRISLYEMMGFYPHNISHYKLALSHKSVGRRNEKGKPLNNERLEFLGDAMLDATVGHIVYRHFEGKREGFLTNTRSKLVSRDTLGKLAEEMGLTRLILSSGQSTSHNSYMAGNAFEALVGAIYLDQGYDAVMRFMEKRILAKMINIDKVAFKEVNFKSKLLEWSQRNRVRLEYRMLKQGKDKDSGSPVFRYCVVLEGVDGEQSEGYSKKEAQQLASEATLKRLKREPQFIDAIFAAKSERTKMEEEPSMAVPNITEGGQAEDFIIARPRENKPEDRVEKRQRPKTLAETAQEESRIDEFDLSDITATPQEKSREDIIAEAEAAAFALLLTILFLLPTTSIQAKVRLPHLLSDNMVLQQQTDARLWGWAKPGATVTVTPSWASQPVTAKAGKDGRWLLSVRTPKASYTPLTLTFDDGDGALTLCNVVSGEVWVCAGQSNMEMPVKGFWGCPVEDYNQTVLDARHHAGVRSVKIPATMRMEPQDDAQCQWTVCTPQTVSEFSATGYFFARTLHGALDIPIAIIEANKGGTRVESWLTKENLQRYTSEPTDSAGIVAYKPEQDYLRALLWGNGTFNPILNYTVKGILFYQGCSNVGDPGNQYSERLKLLVEQWRTQFALGEIPFYFVEIAPYHYDDVQGTNGALLREQQQRASQIIPNSSLVCTNDLAYPYETTQIHPTQKRQVGERLAYTALNRDYGFEQVLYKSSTFKDMIVKSDSVYLHLQDNYHADAPYEAIQGFEVAGDDRVFHPARAQHFWQPGGGYWDEAIILTSPEVKNPVAVRYCFRNFQLGNVTNAANLPLFPFRTDNWF